MSLANFKNRAIIWDTVNKDFPQPIQIMQGDVNARTLSVKIIDNGGEIDLTGHSLKLTYQYTNSSNSGFVMIPPENLTKGEFILVIPTEMTEAGVIEANLILLNEDKEQVIVSKNLTFISDNSTVTDLAQEVNNKIDDFTKLLLENMPQVMRSELNDLHAQTESNKSNIELKANLADMTSLQSAMTELKNEVEAFGISPENLVTIKSLLDAIARNASESEVVELINSVKILTSNISLMSNGDYSPKANQTDLESLQHTVNNQSATVSTKANQTDLDKLQATFDKQGIAISTKANQTDLNKLQADVSRQGFEIATARGTDPTLNVRLSKMDDKDAEITAQLADKAQQVDLLIEKARIDAIQLGLNTKLDAEHGKNLFNPNENNRLDGYYIKYYNGQIAINKDYSTVVIPVSSGDILSFNLGNLHVCALSRIPNLPTSESLAGSFISGFADGLPKQGYVVPTGAVCITVSYQKKYASTLQIERNTSSTAYERYTTGLNATNIIGLKSNDDLIKVGVGYDYETITEAVASVPDESTIMLMPGTYTEAVDIDGTNKFLKIIGFSRDACIWQYDVSDYKNPPLEIGKGIIENITFKCTGTGGEGLRAYNVHIDTNTSKNSSLQFKNCRFINPIRECVGIGLRQNFRLSFINCEFETDSKSCVYCHEEQNNNISGQYIELIDCSMKRNSDGSVILIQETPSLVNNHATIRMQRCIAKNTGTSAVITATQYSQAPINLDGDGFLGTNLWTLDSVSSLNNNSLLNA